MEQWYLGTIGFSYKDWLGGFYPVGTSSRRYLHYYSTVFNSVELDTTFHSIPRQSIVQSWANSTPADFKFCLKIPRLITHELGLQGSQGPMLEFIDSIRPLNEKCGPILIQLPPKFTQDNLSHLDAFLESIPRSHQYAIEFRHPSWFNEKTTRLLTLHQVCWVTNDFLNLPKQINLTSDFLYVRWIGINGEYQHHSYERVDKTIQLKWWLEAIRPFQKHVTEVYRWVG
jgi:uncharacterized protein YecE (DUF72 family)